MFILDPDFEFSMACPVCATNCDREIVDIGVGITKGPWGCPECGWSSSFEYSSHNANKHPAVDQWGGYSPRLVKNKESDKDQ